MFTLCHIKPNTPCIDDPRSSPEPCVRSGGSMYLNLYYIINNFIIIVSEKCLVINDFHKLFREMYNCIYTENVACRPIDLWVYRLVHPPPENCRSNIRRMSMVASINRTLIIKTMFKLYKDKLENSNQDILASLTICNIIVHTCIWK